MLYLSTSRPPAVRVCECCHTLTTVYADVVPQHQQAACKWSSVAGLVASRSVCLYALCCVLCAVCCVLCVLCECRGVRSGLWLTDAHTPHTPHTHTPHTTHTHTRTHSEWAKSANMSKLNAQYRYVQSVRQLPTYGITTFEVADKSKQRVSGAQHTQTTTLAFLLLQMYCQWSTTHPNNDSCLFAAADVLSVEHNTPKQRLLAKTRTAFLLLFRWIVSERNTPKQCLLAKTRTAFLLLCREPFRAFFFFFFFSLHPFCFFFFSLFSFF
jgi:hypothetical protein